MPDSDEMEDAVKVRVWLRLSEDGICDTLAAEVRGDRGSF